MDINKYVTLAIGIALVGIIVGVMGPKCFSLTTVDRFFYCAVNPRRQSSGHYRRYRPGERGNNQYVAPAPHAVCAYRRSSGDCARCYG